MRSHLFCSARWFHLSLSVLVVLIVTLSCILPGTVTFASPEPDIAITPVDNVANPGESFTIDVTIAAVTDLFSYQVKVGFDGTVLGVLDVDEGPFIQDQTTSPLGTYFSYTVEDDDVAVTCATLGVYPGVSGSDLLFNVTFTVEAAGESILQPFDVLLVDSTGAEITPYSTFDANFHTTVPVARFTYTPKTFGRPIVGENVTFDASASYDPDGGDIVSYEWDFNDTSSGTGMIVNHTYSEPSDPLVPYNVTLTVTDDDAETTLYYIRAREAAVNVKFHDITIWEVATPSEVHTREKAVIDVTVINNGSHGDTFNVTTYFNTKPIGTQRVEGLNPQENDTLSFIWNTYITQSTMGPNATGGTWTYPRNATTSDDVYTYTDVNNTFQEYSAYLFDTEGWLGVSKVEVGVEARTDLGGDDQLSIQVHNGRAWSDVIYTYNITSTSDTFFWIDVTESHAWQAGLMNKTRVRIIYNQVGDNATAIYVDWLPMRITPLQPSIVTPGSYAIWANAILVDISKPYPFRPGEEANLADNTLFGSPIRVTEVPRPDIAVTEVEISPTAVAVGRTATVDVKIENLGNREETFDVFLYANSTEPVSNQTSVRMAAGASRQLNFDWYEATNTTVEGLYNVTIYIPSVHANETDLTNNNATVLVEMYVLPVPSFTYAPAEPSLNEVISFDGSSSYAPGLPTGFMTSYLWDFADGTNATGMTATHAFNVPDTYAVKLTVIDNDGLNNTRTLVVRVPKLGSTISIDASRAVVPVSLNTTISGAIAPVRPDVSVTINYTRADDPEWRTLAQVSGGKNGQYSFNWEPTEHGDYQLKAFWAGDQITLEAESPLLNVTVTIQDVTISDLVLSRVRVTPGASLTIDVVAANKGTASETFAVTAYYNDTQLDTQTVESLAAGSTETLSFTWDTAGITEGVYFLRVEAETLPGETYTDDNSRTSGVVIGGLPETPAEIFLYTTIGLGIVVALMAIYLVRVMRAKPKPSG